MILRKAPHFIKLEVDDRVPGKHGEYLVVVCVYGLDPAIWVSGCEDDFGVGICGYELGGEVGAWAICYCRKVLSEFCFGF